MIRDTKSVPVRGLKIVTASEKCGGSVLNLGWWWWRGGGGGLQNKTENCTSTLRFKIRLNMQKN